MDDSYGPALPPHLSNSGQQNSVYLSSGRSGTKRKKGRRSSDSGSSSGSDSDSESSGAAIESDCGKQAPKMIGPVIPSSLKVAAKDEMPDFIGPQIPSCLSSVSTSDMPVDSEDEAYGPRPPKPGQDDGLSPAELLEERSRKMKHKLLYGSEESQPKRESWMTELPEGGLAKHMGLKARKLGDGSKVKDEDQSIWTDSPMERERKANDPREKCKGTNDEPVMSSRDRGMTQQVAEYNKEKRVESLMDIHAKKLKKKMKKEEKKKKKEKKKDKKKKKDKHEDKTERRPFDRDVDLSASRFDNAQKKALIKRSQELNSRFGQGGQKFL